MNGKTYIGKHQTDNLDDGYMGSGKLIKRSIAKYGIENFTKDILHIFNNEIDMNTKEAELVVVSEETYNLCAGGHGGFGYINSLSGAWRHGNTENLILNFDKDIHTKSRKTYSSRLRNGEISISANLIRQHTNETKRKIAVKNTIHQSGENNSQYGTIWITNGTDNKKIRGDIPDGWKRGRTK